MALSPTLISSKQTATTRSDLLWHLSALVIPLVLAGALTYPVMAEPALRVPGWPGDNIAYVWVLHWLKQVVTAGAPLFFDPYAYYPIGYDNSAIESTLANSVPVLPITLAFGPVVAYNVAVLASFVLTSYGTFLWVRTMTPSRTIALACGVASAFFPYRLAHLPGHLPQMSTQWIPLCFFAVERYLRTRQTRWAVIAGAMLALNGLSSWYTLVFVALALPAYVALRAPRLGRVIRERAVWRDLGVALAVVAVMVALAAWPYLRAQQTASRVRSTTETAHGSINPLEFVTLSVRSPIWGDWAARNVEIARDQNVVERVVMPGYIFLAGAIAGVALSRKRRLVRALCGVACVGVFGAMGPVLVDSTGQPIQVPVSASLMQGLERAGVIDAAGNWFEPELAMQMRASQSLIVPLPYALVYRLPVISSMRAVGRYAILMNFAVCGLAALGADALARRMLASRARATSRQKDARWRRARAGIAAFVFLAGALTLVEYWQKPYATVKLGARPVDGWLAGQPFGSVLELPLDPYTQRLSLYARIEHGQPLALGMRGSFPPPADVERRSMLERLPEPEAVRALCSWGARYVLISPRVATTAEIERWSGVMDAVPAARYSGMFDGVRVYVLDGCG